MGSHGKGKLMGDENPAKRLEVREKISRALKGRIMNEEWRKKLSDAQKGKILSEGHKKKISEKLKGTRIGDENPSKRLDVRKKISESKKGCVPWNKGKKHLSLEKNPNWCGGKSFEPYGIDFNTELRKQIRQRDHYRCQQCFRYQDELYTKVGKKYKLHVHHVDYAKKNNNPKNLISLCRSCHAQTNFKREDWINYFQQKANIRECCDG